MPEEPIQNTESTEQGAATGDAEASTESTATSSATGDVTEGSPTQEDWKAIAIKYKSDAEEMNKAKAEGRYVDVLPQQQRSEASQPPANGFSEWDNTVAEARRQLEYNAFELKDPSAIMILANEQKANQSITQAAVQTYPEEMRGKVWAAYQTGRFADLEAAKFAVLGAESVETQKRLAAETARNEQLVKEAKEQAARRTEGVRSTTSTPMTEAEVKSKTITTSKWNQMMQGDPMDPEIRKVAEDVQYGRKTIIPG